MSENIKLSALRRKAQLGQQQFEARAMTGARALRITLAKVAEDELELPLAVIGITETRSNPATMLEGIGDTVLMLLLDTPGRGPGAAFIDASMVAGLIQQQTMGRVSEVNGSVPEKMPTRTDGALVGPLLDSLFARAGELPDIVEQQVLLEGLRFGAFMPSKRLLAMALEGSEYIRYSITADLADGVRQGTIDLLLPPPDVTPAVVDPMAEIEEQPEKTLDQAVLDVPAQLQVALCRLKMPFVDISNLSVGDELKLPEGVLDKTEILTIAGRKIAQGKLGQFEGWRAIRMDVQSSSRNGPERRSSDRRGGLDDHDGSAHTAIEAEAVADAAFEMAALEETALPEIPGMLPDADAPDFGDQGLSDLGSDLPDLPPMPGEPAAAEAENLPALPDLPGLPDLPDLPEIKLA